MYIKQLYTNCLAEAAYYIESNGEAAVIDPLRETTPYTELAAKRGATIKYIFETHFHADFVSGHIDLSRKTGAEIIFGPMARAEYAVTVAEDLQCFQLGDIYIQVLHTPGHTMESSCFLVLNEDGNEAAVFTGDTMFVGDVGRPDLAVSSELSREDLARHMYQSIQRKLLPLQDHVLVFPGHGAGSQCGKSLSDETQSTIGAQKQFNYALQATSEEDFVRKVTAGLNAPPKYFPENARINRMGYERSIDEVLRQADNPLSPQAFAKAQQQKDVVVIDSRKGVQFRNGFIPGSLSISLDGFFAVWVGTILGKLDTPILLVTEPGLEEETTLRLSRVGFENVVGYLDGGFQSWKNTELPIDTIRAICPVNFQANPKDGIVVDVRDSIEFQKGHVSKARNYPLATLLEQIPLLDRNKTYYLYCKSGYRSMVAASLLKRAGFEHVVNIKKGYEGLVDPSKTCCCSKIGNA